MPLRLRATCSKSRSTCGLSPLTTDSRSARRRSTVAFSSAASAAIAWRSASTVFCRSRGERGFRFPFHGGGQIVAREHQLQLFVLDALDLALGEGDLLLHGVIFDVRFHGHRRLAELRQAALVNRDVLFEGAPGGLIRGELLLRGGDHRDPSACVEPCVQRLFPFGRVGQTTLRVVGG